MGVVEIMGAVGHNRRCSLPSVGHWLVLRGSMPQASFEHTKVLFGPFRLSSVLYDTVVIRNICGVHVIVCVAALWGVRWKPLEAMYASSRLSCNSWRICRITRRGPTQQGVSMFRCRGRSLGWRQAEPRPPIVLMFFSASLCEHLWNHTLTLRLSPKYLSTLDWNALWGHFEKFQCFMARSLAQSTTTGPQWRSHAQQHLAINSTQQEPKSCMTMSHIACCNAGAVLCAPARRVLPLLDRRLDTDLVGP